MQEIDFTKAGGLVPAIIQDATTDEVLMLGFMNQEALRITLTTGKVTFWSRTRKKLWTKGETSGNMLQLVTMAIDCDSDTLLIKARLEGSGVCCHTGARSCFFANIT